MTQRLYDIRKHERALLVEFLEYLTEVDRRKVYAEIGFSSLFAFLTDHLGYTSSTAFRRTTAARLLARFPAIGAYLADGRLCLTTLVELRDVLDEGDLVQTLDRAAGKTEAQVRELVASRRPKPAPPDLLRRLPAPREAAAAPVVTPAPTSPQPRAPRIEPISDELRTLRITVDRDFVADLEAVRDALSHQIPDRNIGRVLHECLRRARRELARRREGATDRPLRNPRPSDPSSRDVPAALARELFARDAGRCTYVGPDGTVCGSTYQIEIHHHVPFARGGAMTAANLALMCSTHNAFLAEQDFGAEHIDRAIAHSRDERCHRRAHEHIDRARDATEQLSLL